MRPEHVAIGVYCLGSVLFGLSGLLWLGFIRPYIRRNGMKPGCRVFNWSMIQDYRTARQIANDHNGAPWFVTSFEIVTASALLLGIGFIVWVIAIEL